ncbi:retrovirus-related pol polyprotein from transposon TNT 1-94 [Tanacetum coccineum]
MWNSIQNGPYARPMIPDPDDAVNINGTVKQILEPLSKMTEGNKKQYIPDVKVMNYLLQAIPNDVYNPVDACKNAKEMWERIKRLMFGSDVTSHVGYSRLMDEFDKFAAKEENLQFEPHVLASKAKKVSKNHDPLTLIAHSNASSSQSHANSSYSPQPYYVTHPSSVFSTPTNNRLHTSSNTRNQAVIQDGRVDIQTKNACYGGNSTKNARKQSRNQAFNAGNGNDDNNQIIQRVLRTESNLGKANVQCYNCNERGYYARDC